MSWQQYLTDINFKYIFGDRIEIPTNTYQIHNSVINIFKNAWRGVSKWTHLEGGVGWKKCLWLTHEDLSHFK